MYNNIQYFKVKQYTVSYIIFTCRRRTINFYFCIIMIAKAHNYVHNYEVISMNLDFSVYIKLLIK
jgi:hypothetical protein